MLVPTHLHPLSPPGQTPEALYCPLRVVLHLLPEAVLSEFVVFTSHSIHRYYCRSLGSHLLSWLTSHCSLMSITVDGAHERHGAADMDQSATTAAPTWPGH